MPNCVWIKVTKFMRWFLLSDLTFINRIQVYLDLSSTMVRKYLFPWILGVEKGPQISTCTISKIEWETERLEGKQASFVLQNDKHRKHYEQILVYYNDTFEQVCKKKLMDGLA